VARCSGLSRGSGHRRIIATPCSGGQRPLHGGKAQGGVMSATRRHWSLERGSGRVPRSVSVRKTRHVRDGNTGRVPTDGSCSGLRKSALFTDGTEQVASVGTREPPQLVVMAGWEAEARVSTTGATEVTFLVRPKTCRMHRSGCGVVKRFISSRVESLCAQTQ